MAIFWKGWDDKLAQAFAFSGIDGHPAQELITAIAAIPKGNINTPIGDSKLPPLHYAVMAGREDAVKALLERGADVNKDGGDFTPLSRAVMYHEAEIAKILLVDKNIQADKKDGHGELPFHIAVDNFVAAAEEVAGFDKQKCAAILEAFKEENNRGVDVGLNVPQTTFGGKKGLSVLENAMLKVEADGDERRDATKKAYRELVDKLNEFEGGVVSRHGADMLGINAKEIPSAGVASEATGESLKKARQPNLP